MDGPLAHTTSIWNEDDESDQQDGWTALTASWRMQKSILNAVFYNSTYEIVCYILMWNMGPIYEI